MAPSDCELRPWIKEIATARKLGKDWPQVAELVRIDEQTIKGHIDDCPDCQRFLAIVAVNV